MSSKVDRAVHGPGWGEVILGAVLSLVLGAVLGAALLILKPVAVVRELPKEPARGTVYYIEGSRETAKARDALAKRKAFVEGQSVAATEEEINSLIAAVSAPKTAEAAKAGDKDKAGAGGALVAGTANVRIHGGVLQVSMPVTVNALGLAQKVIVQARGGFEKQGDVFVFEPDQLYIGSCPVQRVPFLASYVEKKILAQQPIPQDIATAWRQLNHVSVEGNTLKLAM